MRLNFRQGLARYQTDALSTPIFLQRSSGAGNFIDLSVSPTPTIIAFAHRSANYIVEETKSVANAWGPISGSTTIYLYWDINVVTGELTRGTTTAPPIYAGSPPTVSVADQHWFDTSESVMRVWAGSKWIEKIRVFAGFLSSGNIIHPYPLGSQAGIVEECEGGNLILDAYNKPLRQSDGTFVTTVSSLLIVNNSAKKVKFEAEILNGLAAEPIPKFSLVSMREGRKIGLGRSTDAMSRLSGIVLEDAYTNEYAYIVTEGLVRNESWAFPANKINRPIFCGANGEVTTTPPTAGVLQVAGFVYDTDAIYMNIFAPIILDDLTPVLTPPAAGAPIADFFASTFSGASPLTVSFTNTSTSPLNAPMTFEWDFTNDGLVDSTSADTSYIFAAPGVYSVRLKAINASGSNEKIQENYIVVTPGTTVGYTNLGINLGGPAQVMRASQFQVSIATSNDGFLTATNVETTITIPDVKNERIIVSNLLPGATSTWNNGVTTIVMPQIPTLASGTTYGPLMLSISAPSVSGTLVVYASAYSPEVDSTIGDNTTSLSIGVKV